MLKITRVEQTEHSTVWVAEGRLVGPWVRELEKALATAETVGSIRLDVSELGFVDHKGLKLLQHLKDQGVELVAVSPFLRELMAMTDVRR